MWPSAGNQSDGDEGTTDGSLTSNSSIASSIGIIGRKNLRADAPVFMASTPDASFKSAYDAVSDPSLGADRVSSYSRESATEYPPT